MIKKPLSKLLSIILTIAICATTVFGCLVSVSAAETPSYIITGAECFLGASNASATVEFSVPQGFAGGIFTIDNANNWFSSVEVSPMGDTTDNISIDVVEGNVVFYITDASGEAKLYTNIALKLDFVFAAPITDTINITISDLDFNGIYYNENYTSFVNNSTNALFTAGCQHKYAVSGNPVYVSEEMNYTVYSKAVCELCNEASTDYQVVPEVRDANAGAISIFTSEEKVLSLLDSTKPNSESNPYIIESANQMYNFLILNSTDAAGNAITTVAGNYFKVADGIKAFYMNGGEVLAAMTSVADVKNYFETTSDNIKTHWAVRTFAGHFDGNGAEIYGLRSDGGNAALFPNVSGNVTIKNVTVRNSYLNGGTYAAGFVGTTDWQNDGTIVIENCAVINNYINSGNANNGAASLVGVSYGSTIKAENILIYGNDFVSKSTASYGAVSSGWSSNSKFTNMVTIGCAPYRVNSDSSTNNNVSWHYVKSDAFSNVYTDQPAASSYISAGEVSNFTYAENQIKQLTLDEMKGSAAKTNMLNLDWNTEENPNGIWFAGNNGQYPALFRRNANNVADTTAPEWKLLGVNIVYENDGSFALNFHYNPSYDSDVKLYVANAESESKSQILTEAVASSFAGTILPESAKMFTLENLSARDIEKLWVATVVTTSANGGETVYGKSNQISIGDYAKEVVLGNAFYDEDATEDEKSADKNVAAALINYGNASADALTVTTPETTTATVVEKWDQTSDGAWSDWYDATYEGGDGTKDNPYIISSAEELANLCRYGSDANVYYKVADEIRAFDMNTVSGVDLTVDDITAQEVKNAVNDKILGKVWFGDAAFKGNFDGNGVTIYGLYAGQAYYNQASFESGSKAGCFRAGLFPKIDASTAVIKNLSIKNSYFKGDPAGAVFGETLGNGGSAAIENIVVANCYIDSTGGYISGVIGGYCLYDADTNSADKAKINNCLVYDNIVYNKDGAAARLIGTMEAYCDNGSGTKVRDYKGFGVSNTIAIGCNIENTGSWWQKDPAFYANCYTTGTPAAENTTITKLASADAAKGIAAKTNMSALDWETVWLYGAEDEYPSIVLGSAKVNPISVYSGTPDTSLAGSGTETDPYLITSADELYAVLCGTTTVSSVGAYFKVIDGIKSFYMNGGATVAELTSSGDVKSYFDNNAPVKVTVTTPFQGIFDGNGATIYGASSTGWYAGLFPQTAGAATIKNIVVKNSYFISSGYTGGLVGGTWVNGTPTSSLTLENCIVANCYIDNTHASNSCGALIGQFASSSGSPVLTVNNCLVYGNLINNASGAINGAITGAGGGTNNNSTYRQIKNSVFLGISPATGEYWPGNCGSGSIYTNCYTDTDFTGAANVPIYTTGILEKINPDDAKGSAAKTAMPALAWDSVWYTDNFGGYPSFKEASNLPPKVQSQYDTVTFNSPDTIGGGTEYNSAGNMTFGVYQTALSLKANPYMSFAFAFLGEYKENRDDIKIRFTYTENGASVTSEEISVPAYTGADIVNINGWTNTANNGRYHTYKATDIPVEALANGIKVEANYNNQGWKDFGTYSASGLGLQFERANRLNPCEYYETRVETAKAFLFYAQMLQARYGA